MTRKIHHAVVCFVATLLAASITSPSYGCEVVGTSVGLRDLQSIYPNTKRGKVFKSTLKRKVSEAIIDYYPITSIGTPPSLAPVDHDIRQFRQLFFQTQEGLLKFQTFLLPDGSRQLRGRSTKLPDSNKYHADVSVFVEGDDDIENLSYQHIPEETGYWPIDKDEHSGRRVFIVAYYDDIHLFGDFPHVYMRIEVNDLAATISDFRLYVGGDIASIDVSNAFCFPPLPPPRFNEIAYQQHWRPLDPNFYSNIQKIHRHYAESNSPVGTEWRKTTSMLKAILEFQEGWRSLHISDVESDLMIRMTGGNG